MSRSRTAWGSVTYERWASRTDQELAHELGVVVNVVRERRRRFGHPRPPDRRKRASRSPSTERQVRSAYRPAPTLEGRRGRPPACDWHAISVAAWASRTNAELARDLAVSAVTVGKWRARLDAPPGPARHKGGG